MFDDREHARYGRACEHRVHRVAGGEEYFLAAQQIRGHDVNRDLCVLEIAEREVRLEQMPNTTVGTQRRLRSRDRE